MISLIQEVIAMKSLDNVEAVQRMQDYINEHILENITLSMLAKISGYSAWHAARIFKELVGKTPFDYIRDIRLSKAAIELRDGKSKVVHVSLDFVFDSHEGFTRAFSKKFGLSPREYRKATPPIPLFIPYDIRSYYEIVKKGECTMNKKESKNNTIFVQVIERPARKLILKRGIKATHYFEYCQEVGCDVWGVLTSVKEALYEPVGMWLPKKLVKSNTSTYVQGVEVPQDYKGQVPQGFDLIDLEPCKVMVFQGQPYDDEEFMEAIDELWKAIDDYNPEIYGFQWAAEEAPRFQLAPMGYRGYIEARPVREIKTK